MGLKLTQELHALPTEPASQYLYRDKNKVPFPVFSKFMNTNNLKSVKISKMKICSPERILMINTKQKTK